MRTWPSLLLLGSFLVACDSGDAGGDGETGIDSSPTGSDPGGSSTTGAPTPATTTSTTGQESTTSGPPGDDTSGEDEGPTPPINFDLGVTPDFGELDDGCNAVDFLFVIDNSGSMGPAQDNLVANFPAFINGIQATLTDVDSFHVGIATSDPYDGNPIQCRQLGALVTATTGFDSSNATCGPYTEGFSYITEADDLSTSFQCAAQVGTSGDGYELMMNAMEAAIGPDLNAEGACNEGFIRDHALLVVVIITDEADGPGDSEGLPPNNSSSGTPKSWYETAGESGQGESGGPYDTESDSDADTASPETSGTGGTGDSNGSSQNEPGDGGCSCRADSSGSPFAFWMLAIGLLGLRRID